MTNTKTIKTTDLQVGDIVHFYNARFEVLSVSIKDGVLSSNAKWLDGFISTGYFGSNKNWNFQGNDLARVVIEVKN